MSHPQLRTSRWGLATLVIAWLTVLPLLTGSASAVRTDAPQPAPSQTFSWPLTDPHPVVRPFQAPSSPYGAGHRGVDLGGTPGEPVTAAADGTVVFAGHLVDRGVVSIDHHDGSRTTYEPVTPTVVAGQTVSRGGVIGTLTTGHPDCVDAPACLHWGLRHGEEYLNPLILVSGGHVRLLPVPAGP